MNIVDKSFIAKTKTIPTNIFDIDINTINKITEHLKEIPTETIDKLITKLDVYTFISSDNTKVTLTFLGKGDEGTVYDYNNILAVKFFVSNTNNEINFLKKLRKLYHRSVTIHTLIMYGHFIKDEHLILLINKADGNIDKWMKELDEDGINIDIEWYHMMLQILYGLLIIQKKLLTYHKDLLHRNILYKILDEPIEIKYKLIIDGKKTIIRFKTTTIFFISDFGKSQSLILNDNNIMSDDEIMQNINSNKDLEGLSSIYNKLFVDYIYHNIEHKKLYDMVKNDDKAKQNLKDVEEKMTAKAKIISKPSNYVKLQVTRTLCYYLIENKYVNIDDLKKKIDASIPSKKVRKILESLCDERPIITKMRIIKKQLKIFYC